MCFSRKVILATITLDLFAVLLGGATALMPIFADQILHCGPVGLGWMRAMPAVGAFVMALLIAHLPPMKHAGKTLLWCVTGFGAATILFGLSKVFWLSLGVLLLIGAFDSVSVIIRGSIVQLITPDEMRGRVSSVNNIFIGTSNEFGALESGLTAALFGPVISVVAGGIGTILVVLGVAWRWPETRKIGALDRNLRLSYCRRGSVTPGRHQRCRLQSKMRRVTKSFRRERRRPGDSARQHDKNRSSCMADSRPHR